MKTWASRRWPNASVAAPPCGQLALLQHNFLVFTVARRWMHFNSSQLVPFVGDSGRCSFLSTMSGNGRLDLVHQNAIHVETIRKAQKYQKLHTEFSINPRRKCESASWSYLHKVTACDVPFKTNFTKYCKSLIVLHSEVKRISMF